MATRTFNVSTDAHVVYDPGLNGKGGGKDQHVAIGYIGGYIYRGLLKFTLDFSGMYGITSAVLNFKTANAAHGSTSTSTVLVRRNTSSWSEGTYGADCAFYTANAVNWDNKPSTTTTGGVSYSHTGTNDTWDSVNITDIVKAWAPTSIPGGGGASNYGITLRQESETSGHFSDLYSREKGSTYDAYITVTYSDTPPQTNPTATHVSPAANGLAEIYNLATDLTTPSADDTGFTARCQFRFTYSDTEGHSMSKYQVQVYQSDGTTLVHNSGEVVATAASGSTVTYQATTWAPSADTEYKWKVTVWDNYSTPGSSTTALTSFKLRWGYAISRIDLGSTGTTGLSAVVTPASTQTNTRRAIFYRGHDGSTGKGNWSTNVSTVATATYRYVDVYIRLSSDVSGTNASVDKVSITYQQSGSQPLPKQWYLMPPTYGRWAVDEGDRRFGSKSLKAEGVAHSTHYLQARADVNANGTTYLKVTPNTDYVFACYVKTEEPLATGARLYLGIYDKAVWVSGSGIAGAWTVDTSDGPEGWERLVLKFKTGPTVDAILASIIYYDGGNDANRATYWLDGASLTEGTVVPPWAQGTVSSQGTISSSGIEIDGSAGGQLMLRGAAGGIRDVVALGSSGFVLGGDAEIHSPYSGVIFYPDGSFVSRGATTGAASSGTSGYWSKIGSGVINNQYANVSFIAAASSWGSSTADMPGAIVRVNIKQQAAIGSAPDVSVRVLATSGEAKRFAVVVTGLSGSTQYEMYVQAGTTYEYVNFAILQFRSSYTENWSVHTGQTYVASLPSGTVHYGVEWDADTGWRSVSYLNSWTTYNASWPPARYRKDAMGYVHISGMIAGGTIGQAAFTLPSGYRPAASPTSGLLFSSISSSGGGARIDVQPNGNVVIAAGATGWTSLEGITFKAEQ